MSTSVKFPDVHVQLSGIDGNAMSIMATVARGLRHAGHGSQVCDFMDEAMSGDYENVIATAMRWVEVS